MPDSTLCPRDAFTSVRLPHNVEPGNPRGARYGGDPSPRSRPPIARAASSQPFRSFFARRRCSCVAGAPWRTARRHRRPVNRKSRIREACRPRRAGTRRDRVGDGIRGGDHCLTATETGRRGRDARSHNLAPGRGTTRKDTQCISPAGIAVTVANCCGLVICSAYLLPSRSPWSVSLPIAVCRPRSTSDGGYDGKRQTPPAERAFVDS